MSGPRRAWLRGMHRRYLRRIVFGAGGSAFTPTQISGLTLWLDAHVGLFQTSVAGAPSGDTDQVGTWVDQSAAGNKAVQGTLANKPSLQLDAGHAIGFGPFVSFDGVNDTMTVFNSLTAGTVFVVLYNGALGTQARIIDADDTGGWSIQLNLGTQHYEVVGITVASDFWVNGALSVLAAVPQLATTRVLSAKVTTPSVQDVALGSKVTALGTDPMAGGLREILIYTGRLSDSDRVSVQNYLFLKWMPVTAGFTGTTSGFVGDTFSFLDASEYAASWSWEKNDGSGWVPFAGTPTAQSPNETLAAGTWSIRQTVTGHGGDVNTLTRTNYVVVSSFTPLSLTGLSTWLKADAGTLQTSGGSAAVADTDPVGQWQDQSGNNNHFGQTTAGKRPRLKLAIQNGLPVVRFDGIDDLMTLTHSITQPFSAAFAVRCSVANNGYVLDGASINQNVVSFPNGTTVRGYAGAVLDATVADSTIFAVLTVVFNGASSVVRWNGVETAGAASVSGNFGGFTLGSGGDGTQPFTGDVGEVILCDAVISPADRISVENYLNSRWAAFSVAVVGGLSLIAGGVLELVAGGSLFLMA